VELLSWTTITLKFLATLYPRLPTKNLEFSKYAVSGRTYFDGNKSHVLMMYHDSTACLLLLFRKPRKRCKS
jgi:hypothetical protein